MKLAVGKTSQYVFAGRVFSHSLSQNSHLIAKIKLKVDTVGNILNISFGHLYWFQYFKCFYYFVLVIVNIYFFKLLGLIRLRFQGGKVIIVEECPCH